MVVARNAARDEFGRLAQVTELLFPPGFVEMPTGRAWTVLSVTAAYRKIDTG